MPAVSGTTKDATGAFARRLVRVHRRDTGALVGEALSNPSTGAWSVTTADYSKHYAVAHDSDAWITYLPFNGDNGSTSFAEWGGKAVTAVGNAAISTAHSKFGGASAYFDGNGDYLSIPASVDLNFGTADFTVEAWVYPQAASNQKVAGIWSDTTGQGFSWKLEVLSNGALSFMYSTTGANETAITSTSGVIPLNAWTHVCAVRAGNVLYVYANGVAVASSAITASLYAVSATKYFEIGRDGAGNTRYFTGYIDDLCITKGVARYTADFTPPTAPHGDALSQMANAMVFDFLTPA